MKNVINLSLIFLLIVLFSSCDKKNENYERDFTALIMQNKVYVDDVSYSGFRYAIKEEDKDYVNTSYYSIVGFDSLYTEGYQYKVHIKEICSNSKELRQDVLGCQLNLVSIRSTIKKEETFTIKN